MAKLTKYGWIPEPHEVINGSWKPDPKETGKRFEVNPDGSGTLYIRRLRMRAGFRKPIEEWVAIKKFIMQGTPYVPSKDTNSR
jgi:hypothetical protein